MHDTHTKIKKLMDEIRNLYNIYILAAKPKAAEARSSKPEAKSQKKPKARSQKPEEAKSQKPNARIEKLKARSQKPEAKASQKKKTIPKKLQNKKHSISKWLEVAIFSSLYQQGKACMVVSWLRFSFLLWWVPERGREKLLHVLLHVCGPPDQGLEISRHFPPRPLLQTLSPASPCSGQLTRAAPFEPERCNASQRSGHKYAAMAEHLHATRHCGSLV